jgi:hypothetical protein
MKEKLKEYKLVGIPNNNQDRLVQAGKLVQKGLAERAY